MLFRSPFDPDGAKKLLAEAGYPNGFGITLSGPNNRYINDEQILQAVAQMFTRVGIQTKVEALPLAVYFPKARKEETSVSLLGWVSFAGDLALRSLLAELREKIEPRQGHVETVAQALAHLVLDQRRAGQHAQPQPQLGLVVVRPLGDLGLGVERDDRGVFHQISPPATTSAVPVTEAASGKQR